MTGTVIEIWRHPIKSHGREALSEVTVSPGQTMPGDRIWAVAHEKSLATSAEWSPCANFSRVSKAPALMAMTSAYDDTTGQVTLHHPDRPDLTFDPDGAPDAFLDWVAPLMPENRAQSARFVRVPGRGMTDSDFPSITLGNMASHRAVEQRLNQKLSIHRWRNNIWFDRLPGWEEFDWLNREVQIGQAVFFVRERTDRCLATTANPETGRRDADTLAALESWGHQDFTVRAEVVRGGTIRTGDAVTPL
ncbi:MAG: MOSC domain-containing protein [Rhodobacteraceae bacterium]|nr:MOSC domain-containing protein [Paracoccaceae bacterium]